jgi:hypothetical protein
MGCGAPVQTPYRTFYAFEEVSAAFKDLPGARGIVLDALEQFATIISEGEVTRLIPESESQRDAVVARYSLAEVRSSVDLGPLEFNASRFSLQTVYQTSEEIQSARCRFDYWRSICLRSSYLISEGSGGRSQQADGCSEEQRHSASGENSGADRPISATTTANPNADGCIEAK